MGWKQIDSTTYKMMAANDCHGCDYALKRFNVAFDNQLTEQRPNKWNI